MIHPMMNVMETALAMKSSHCLMLELEAMTSQDMRSRVA